MCRLRTEITTSSGEIITSTSEIITSTGEIIASTGEIITSTSVWRTKETAKLYRHAYVCQPNMYISTCTSGRLVPLCVHQMCTTDRSVYHCVYIKYVQQTGMCTSHMYNSQQELIRATNNSCVGRLAIMCVTPQQQTL